MISDVRLIVPALITWVVAAVGLRIPQFGVAHGLYVLGVCVVIAGLYLLAMRHRLADSHHAHSGQQTNSETRPRRPSYRATLCVFLLLCALVAIRAGTENELVERSGIREASENGLFASGEVRVTSDAKPVAISAGASDQTREQYTFTAKVVALHIHGSEVDLPLSLIHI